MVNQENLLSKEKTTKENRIWVRIASACNNKCIFCLDSDAQNGTFPKEEFIKSQIKKGLKEGYENRIIISGGEASINPKFPEYIQYAKEVGYDRVQTVTNGNMFASEKFCKKVFDAGLEEVTFSFHGHNEKLHDYLVATPGAFRKSLSGLIYIKKNFPHIILNIDIVVNKINIPYLPNIVKFFMKLGVYEFDILQIIPFGRGFHENKEKLFYNTKEFSEILKETWKLSRTPGVYMWTNRFPAESFEGFEDLIQDPRKIKSEVMGESYEMFKPFIESGGKKKPECFGEACKYCFLHQYCHDFINSKRKSTKKDNYQIIPGKEFPSEVFETYGKTKEDFLDNLKKYNKPLLNIPICLGGSGEYESFKDMNNRNTLEEYTKSYIQNLYRKKGLHCDECKFSNSCEGIHVNFIRSYGFDILKPIK